MKSLLNTTVGKHPWTRDEFCAACSIMAVDTTLPSRAVLVKLFIPKLRWVSVGFREGKKYCKIIKSERSLGFYLTKIYAGFHKMLFLFRWAIRLKNEIGHNSIFCCLKFHYNGPRPTFPSGMWILTLKSQNKITKNENPPKTHTQQKTVLWL